MTWVNDLFQGIFLGGAYALTAVGLSLMFGVMRLVNLAHGDLAVCGTYLVTTIMAATGVPLWAAMLIMVPLAFGLGMALQLSIFGRALRTGPTAPAARSAMPDVSSCRCGWFARTPPSARRCI